MHTDRWQYLWTEMLCKRKQKKAKIKEFIYAGTMNVKHEMYDNTGNNWSQFNSNTRFKEKFGSHTEKRFNRLTTRQLYWEYQI
jgi:hypothetical protein